MVISGLVLSVYILNTCIGGLSNIAFVYKVWNTKSKKNPLLIGMIVFDLSVCTISCPVKTFKRIFKPHLKTLTGVIFLDFLEVRIIYIVLVYFHSNPLSLELKGRFPQQFHLHSHFYSSVFALVNPFSSKLKTDATVVTLEFLKPNGNFIDFIV